MIVCYDFLCHSVESTCAVGLVCNCTYLAALFICAWILWQKCANVTLAATAFRHCAWCHIPHHSLPSDIGVTDVTWIWNQIAHRTCKTHCQIISKHVSVSIINEQNYRFAMRWMQSSLQLHTFTRVPLHSEHGDKNFPFVIWDTSDWFDKRLIGITAVICRCDFWVKSPNPQGFKFNSHRLKK